MYYENIDGFFDFSDLYDKIVDHFPSGATFVEVGVWQGKSICYLAETIQAANKQIWLYAVDTWKWMGEKKLKPVVEENNGDMFPVFISNMKSAGVESMIKPIRSDSAEAAKRFKDESLDFIFIDAGHSADSIRKDLHAWAPKLKKDGIIAGHDYKAGGVKTEVNKFFGGRVKAYSVDSWIVE